MGGERGRAALARLKNAIGRVEASWRPASPDEGFEIVRRRLFQPIADPKVFVDRDQVARSFVEMYGTQHQEFPPDCREASYERRIKAAYPIHPELFDRLFNDWSTLEKFQRTRGVLRLMAAVIHSLWERQDSNLLIMPANVPVDDIRVQFELTRYLEDSWHPVIEKDVDGQHSLPLALDRDNPNLGRYSACRRVARTIYMGSAPTQRAANRGIEDRQVKLGCVQPGESVATFGDALRRLTDRATYLYVDGRRYWYSTQPTVTRLAEDRATQLHEHEVSEEIIRRVRKEQGRRGDFEKVHACPASHADVPDEAEARLVILGPEHPHTAKTADSRAMVEAQTMLDTRGSAPRNYRNTLVFLAADSNRIRELEAAARQYLAWNSIWQQREPLNLDPFQTRQAETKRQSADETVEIRIPETYQWILVPEQPDPKGGVDWREIGLRSTGNGHDGLAAKASKKLKNDGLLLVQMGGNVLRQEIDRVPLWRGEKRDQVSVKLLAEDFAKYLYLSRIKNVDVLLGAIHDGVERLTWRAETFAYAERFDEQQMRFVGLRAGQPTQVLLDNNSVLVNSETAAKQMDADRQVAAAEHRSADAAIVPTPKEVAPDGSRPELFQDSAPPAAKLRRFHGAVEVSALRAGRDTGKIAEEVIQHLAALNGSSVKVTIEIEAEIPDGASEELIRTVTENCRTLRFKQHGFEES